MVRLMKDETLKLLTAPDITPSEVKLYLYLGLNAQGGIVRLRREDIAAATGEGRSTVFRALMRLRERGFVTLDNRKPLTITLLK